MFMLDFLLSDMGTCHRAARSEQLHVMRRGDLLPAQLFWGWAEGYRWGARGLWDSSGCAAVWSDAGEDRCGRPAAAAGGGGGGEGDYDGVAAVAG